MANAKPLKLDPSTPEQTEAQPEVQPEAQPEVKPVVAKPKTGTLASGTQYTDH
jgi:hypothetical protein